ncbi:unnamed protein product [Diatraea saccharalis]|uniref:RCC1-like domain-containing protein n=1 Tax=Diatraea saccharalis TaxID=40085 RepID=A0A9N9QVK9_9NEOP|nr:unnamed protein product [Diatraea saccharalis]
MLFSWGANSHGQLGLGVVNEQVETASKVIIESTTTNIIKQICCGGGHTLLLDSEGKLFSCGWNHKLQSGTETETHDFQRVWKLSGITFVNIACGWDFSCGVTDDKFLFVWGSNSNGELGLPKEQFPDVVKPIRLQINACAVSMGLKHSAVINSKGEVWITGYGRHGQLGLGSEILSTDRFQIVPKVGKISHVACGQNHTTAWCSEEKALYVWGDNRHGQLLLDTVKYKKVFTPQKIDIDVKQNVKKLFSGWTNSLLWLENGELVAWGRNNYGQLGTNESLVGKIFHVKLPGNRHVQDVAVGSEHSICLATDNTLWSWGWNEHANTGTNIEEKSVYQPTLVPLKLDSNLIISQIYAGGAQNFVVMSEKEEMHKNKCKNMPSDNTITNEE